MDFVSLSKFIMASITIAMLGFNTSESSIAELIWCYVQLLPFTLSICLNLFRLHWVCRLWPELKRHLACQRPLMVQADRYELRLPYHLFHVDGLVKVLFHCQLVVLSRAKLS